MKAKYEKVSFEEGSSVTAFKTGGERFDAPWHFHPESELTYIISSHGIRYVGNHISDFSAGDLVLLGPNLPHCWINDESNTEPAHAFVIQWQSDLFQHVPEFSGIRKLQQDAQRGLHFKATQAIIDKIEHMAKTEGIERLLLLAGCLALLGDQPNPATLAGATYATDFSAAINNRIQAIQQFVKQHYRTKVTLSQVASHLHMTEQSFSRFFSKVMDRPFFVFLNEYRCNVASRLLLETDLQVAEIGYQCGYESLPFFYQQFRKFKRHSPLNFRKQYRQLT